MQVIVNNQEIDISLEGEKLLEVLKHLNKTVQKMMQRLSELLSMTNSLVQILWKIHFKTLQDVNKLDYLQSVLQT